MESETMSYLETCPSVSESQALQHTQGLNMGNDPLQHPEDSFTGSVTSTQVAHSCSSSESEHMGEPVSHLVTGTVQEEVGRKGQGPEEGLCRDIQETANEQECREVHGTEKGAQPREGKGVGEEGEVCRHTLGAGEVKQSSEGRTGEAEECREQKGAEDGVCTEAQGAVDDGAFIKRHESGAGVKEELEAGSDRLPEIPLEGQGTGVEQGVGEERTIMDRQESRTEVTEKEEQEDEKDVINKEWQGLATGARAGVDTTLEVTSVQEQSKGGPGADWDREADTGAELQEPVSIEQMAESELDTDTPQQVTRDETGADVKGLGEQVAGVQHPVPGEDTTVKGDGTEAQDIEKGSGAGGQGIDTSGVGTDAMGTNTGVRLTGDGICTSVQASAEETGVDVTGVRVQVGATEEQASGELRQLQEAGEERAGAQVCVSGSEVQSQDASEVGTGGQVSASGREAGRKVTPNLSPVREGTSEPDRPAACWEKEWPLLMYNEKEVRADTAGQGETQQGTVTGQDLCSRTPEMRDRDSLREGETPVPETPIEREIRLILEREQLLRQERGITLPVGQQELVEVRRKAVTIEQGPPADKERQLAGAQMQRDIQQETRREQDLVELGQVMGAYDRGQQQELQERKMIFESLVPVSSDTPSKKRQSIPPQVEILDNGTAFASDNVDSAVSNHVAQVASGSGGKKGPSYAEANGSNVILIEHSSLLRRSTPMEPSGPIRAEPPRYVPVNPPSPADEDSPRNTPGSPFLRLRSPSPRSLLEKEIEEVKERERELRRQRSSLYGRDVGAPEAIDKEPETKGDIQTGTYQPERPSWRRLDVNWPPNKDYTTNGQHQEQGKDSPRTRRQRSSLIQSWESGTPNPQDAE